MEKGSKIVLITGLGIAIYLIWSKFFAKKALAQEVPVSPSVNNALTAISQASQAIQNAPTVVQQAVTAAQKALSSVSKVPSANQSSPVTITQAIPLVNAAVAAINTATDDVKNSLSSVSSALTAVQKTPTQLEPPLASDVAVVNASVSTLQGSTPAVPTVSATEQPTAIAVAITPVQPTIQENTQFLIGGTSSVDNSGGSHGNGLPDATWDTGNVPYPHWWQYDLGSGVAKTVRVLKVYEDRGYLKDFILQGSNDGSNWVNIFSGQHGNATGWESYAINNQTAYRFYRIYLPGQNWDWKQPGDNTFASIGAIVMTE